MRNKINIALPKGRLGEKVYDIFEKIGCGCPEIHEGGRKLVFEDEDRVEIFDEGHSIDEDRYITIGMAGEILFVVYTERKEAIRLISARLANARERSLYYGYGKI